MTYEKTTKVATGLWSV